MMNKDIFVKLLQERRYKSVKDVLDVMNAVDIASLLGEFDDKELALAFRLIPKEKAADVFANMEFPAVCPGRSLVRKRTEGNPERSVHG